MNTPTQTPAKKPATAARTIAGILLLLLGMVVPAFAQTAVVMPEPKIQFFDNSGDPLNGGKLFSYLPGTTTPLETCSSSVLVAGACQTANLNPVILDTAGRASVFLRPQVYKFILQTSAGVQIWSADNITSTQYLGTGTASTSTFLRGDYTWTKPVTILTSTSVGTQTPLAPGIVGSTFVRLNNASLLTITTFEAGYDGQQVELQAIGAGQVDINDSASALGTAANRILTGTSGTISLAAGLGRVRMVYDATTARWRVQLHEQGQIIGYTPTWAASGTQPVLNNGTLNAHFYTRGKQVTVHLYFSPGTTTTFGTGTYTFTLPFTASSTTIGQASGAMIFDTSAGTFFIGAAYVNTTTTITVVTSTGQIGQTVPMTWASGDLLLVELTYYLP